MTDAIEARLLRYSDSHLGRTVTLQIERVKGTPHPFEDLPCGSANGQRMAVAFTLINDDESREEVVPNSRETRVSHRAEHKTQPRQDQDKPSPGGAIKTAAQQAGWLCTLRSFQQFLNETRGYEIESTEDAAESVRDWCDITSRSEIDANPKALAVWRTLTADYDVWLRDLIRGALA